VIGGTNQVILGHFRLNRRVGGPSPVSTAVNRTSLASRFRLREKFFVGLRTLGGFGNRIDRGILTSSEVSH